eukprot:4401781-Amphidinium_carterae.3
MLLCRENCKSSSREGALIVWSSYSWFSLFVGLLRKAETDTGITNARFRKQLDFLVTVMQLQMCARQCEESECGLQQIASMDTDLLERLVALQVKLDKEEKEGLEDEEDMTELEKWKSAMEESTKGLNRHVQNINQKIQASVLTALQKATSELAPIAGGKQGQSWKAKLKKDAALSEVLANAEHVLRGPMAARIAKGFRSLKQAQQLRCQNSSFLLGVHVFCLCCLGP